MYDQVPNEDKFSLKKDISRGKTVGRSLMLCSVLTGCLIMLALNSKLSLVIRHSHLALVNLAGRQSLTTLIIAMFPIFLALCQS